MSRVLCFCRRESRWGSRFGCPEWKPCACTKSRGHMRHINSIVIPSALILSLKRFKSSGVYWSTQSCTRSRGHTHDPHIQSLMYRRRRNKYSVGNYPECSLIISLNRNHTVNFNGALNAISTNWAGDWVVGAHIRHIIIFIKRSHFLCKVKSLRKKKFHNTRDKYALNLYLKKIKIYLRQPKTWKSLGAPGSAARKGSPVSAESHAHVTLYYHPRGTNQVEWPEHSNVDKVAWTHTRSARTTP